MNLQNNNLMERKVFLSSSYDESMLLNRELFRADILARFNMISGVRGINTYLIDFEYGIPKGTSQETVIKICVENILISDMFICILNDKYGHKVKISELNSDVKETVIKYGYRSVDEEFVSVLEIEILTALRYIPQKSTFLLYDYNCLTGDIKRLVSYLRLNNIKINMFTDVNSLATITVNEFRKIMCFSNENALNELQIYQNRYLARKLRYYVSMDIIVQKIDDYVNSDFNKVLIIEGKENSGKSMALAAWMSENVNNTDYDIYEWNCEIGEDILSNALLRLMDESGIDVSGCFFQEDSIFLFIKTLKENIGKKRVYILDGLYMLREIDSFGWIYTDLDPSVKLIISRRISDNKTIESFKLIRTEKIDNNLLLKNIYCKEGKMLEYSKICLYLESICSGWDLRQLTQGIHQFLRVVRYNQIENEYNFIQHYLSNIRDEYGVFIHQCNYLSTFISLSQIKKNIALITLSERGLSESEIFDLTNGNSNIIYQFYFILNLNEDLYNFPEYIRNNFNNELTDETKREVRTVLADYFSNIDDDGRAVIEYCYQLYMLEEKDELKKLLGNITIWRIIESNSSLYPCVFINKLTDKDWKSIIFVWKKQIKNDNFQFTEKELYSIAQCMYDLGRIRDVVAIFRILVSRGGNNLSLLSYYQHMASCLEELEDEEALQCADKAVNCLNYLNDEIYVQSRIDTYMEAAVVYAHMLKIKENLQKNKEVIIKKIEDWTTEAIKLSEDMWIYYPEYTAANYHRVAYIYHDLGKNDVALKYVEKAINQRDISEELVNSMLLKAQIIQEQYIESSDCNYNMGVLQIDKDGDANILYNAIDTIVECHSVFIKIKDKIVNSADKKILGNIYTTWAMILYLQDEWEKAIEINNLAIEVEKNDEEIIDFYLTCYHSGLFYERAFNQTGEMKYGEFALVYAKKAIDEIYKTTELRIEDDLKDIQQLIQRIEIQIK